MIWIKNAPIFDANDPSTFEKCEQFIDEFVTCKKDESLGDLMNRQYHKHTATCKKNVKSSEVCRFDYPRPPMRKTKILLPLGPDDDKKKAKELMKEIEIKTEQIARTNEDCSFDEYLEQLNVDEDSYIQAVRSKLKKPTVCLRRNVNERKINAYNRDMLILWEANMDIQFILSGYCTVKYVCSYLSKSHKGISKLLSDVAEQISKGNDELKSKLRTIVNAFVNNCEISAQEIALHVLSLHVCKCSASEIFINTNLPNDRIKIKKGKNILESLNEHDPDSTDVSETDIIHKYINRPHELESLCLADFSALWTYSTTLKKKKGSSTQPELNTNSDDESSCENNDCSDSDDANSRTPLRSFPLLDKGFVTERRKRRIIRYRNYSMNEDKLNFIREHLMLYTSWRTEPSINDEHLERKFIEQQNDILSIRKHYCKYELDPNELMDVIQEYSNDSDDENDDHCSRTNPFTIYELESAEADIITDIPHIDSTSKKTDMMSKSFLIPKLIPEDDFLTSIRQLNEGQRRYLLNIVHLIKTRPNEPFFHFISGGAGVGKSTLIKAVQQCLNRYWIHQLNVTPDTVKILPCSPFGRPAAALKGFTLHYAMQFGNYNLRDICYNAKLLNADKRNTLQCLYTDLKIIIIDEISLCGAHMLWALNIRLQEIFDSQLPFAGLSLIVVGDLNQLPPINDSPVYACPNDPLQKISGPELWSHFRLYELTEIMRQKDDLKFAMALNNLAVGSTTDEDDELFRSRQLSNLNVELFDLLPTVTCLYHANIKADAHNSLYLSLMNTEKAISPAFDTFNGPGKEKTKQYMLNKAREMHFKKTANLQYELKLVVDARYNITVNLNIPDGIANQSPCTLRKIVYGKTNSGNLVPLRIYVEFEDPSAGEMTRSTKKDLIKKDNALPSWTPIERFTRNFTVTSGSMSTVTRNQIPVTPAAASTVHSAQSTTSKHLMVHIGKGLSRKLKYTAFSRVPSSSGLYIDGEYTPPPKATIENDSALREMHRMRAEAPLEFLLQFPEDYKTEGTILCIFYNIRSLNKHFEDISNSKTFISSDLICLAETWTLPTDSFILDGFKCIHRTDCNRAKRFAFGTFIFAKETILHNLNLFYENQTILDKGHLTIVGIKIKTTAIIFVYKSPKVSFNILQDNLQDALDIIPNLNVNLTVIAGDFNIKYYSDDANYKSLSSFINSAGLHTSLSAHEVSTDTGSLIDLCFSSDQHFKANVFESVTSDHKPIWFTI